MYKILYQEPKNYGDVLHLLVEEKGEGFPFKAGPLQGAINALK